MTRGVLYVLAKDPVPGFVKTRLCPPLSPEQAAAVAVAFATDTLATAVASGGFDVRLALAAPARDGPVRLGEGLAALALRLGVRVEDQGEGDLGGRMARLLDRGLRSGPTVLVGTDCPDLPAAMLVAAFAALERRDVVVGPAVDGGYVLIGARRPVPGLFEIDAPWSSERVMEATCAVLRRRGCAFETLETRDDVDDARALGRLASRLAGASVVAPATAGLLARWRDEGVSF